jgi:hypothetical protein
METGRSWLDSISRLGLVINDKSHLKPTARTMQEWLGTEIERANQELDCDTGG